MMLRQSDSALSGDGSAFHLWDEPHEVLARILGAARCLDSTEDAARLLSIFGCIERVLQASWLELVRAAGWQLAWSIKRVPATRRSLICHRMGARPRFQSVRCLERFIADYTVGRPLQQEVIAVYVDSGSRLMRLSSGRLTAFAGDRIDIASLISAGQQMGAAGFFVLRQEAKCASAGSFLSLVSKTYVTTEHVPLMQQFALPPGHVGFVEQCSVVANRRRLPA